MAREAEIIKKRGREMGEKEGKEIITEGGV